MSSSDTASVRVSSRSDEGVGERGSGEPGLWEGDRVLGNNYTHVNPMIGEYNAKSHNLVTMFAMATLPLFDHCKLPHCKLSLQLNIKKFKVLNNTSCFIGSMLF